MKEEEAKSAKLKEKEILKLRLYWNPVDRYDKDEKVLEGLQPHLNLKSLTIYGYRGKKFPSWVGLSLYHNLIKINLSSCIQCEEVPTLGHLPCLRVLKILDMLMVKSLGSEFYSYSDGSYRNNILFASLRILKLDRMFGLQEWKDAKELASAGEVLTVFPFLEKLTLHECPNLSSLPGVPSVIRHLKIIRCGIDELPSGLQFYTSLKYLKIEECPNLKSILDLGEVFLSLSNLQIGNCRDLRLKLLREGLLKTLVIGGFIKEILCYPSIRDSLKKLILLGRPTLNSLPNEIQHFTALEELLIGNFNGMEALPDWFSYLSSLQKLSLYKCKKLMDLPILHLTNLKHLHIDDCRNLEIRHAEGSSVEWFQIAQGPNIRIDGECIKGGEDSNDFEDFGWDYFDVFDDSEDE